MYQLLGRELGTNNFPDCSNMCHESSGVALKESIGIGKGTVQLEDFEKTELIVIMGHNPATNHPRMLSDLQKAAQRGAKIVSINPIKEKGLQSFIHPQDFKALLTGQKSKISSHYIQPNIGGDLAFLTGVIKVILQSEFIGKIDSSFISTHTVGFETLQSSIESTTWETILEESGVVKSEIETVAKLYLESEATIVCWGMGITQHKYGVATIQQVVNLLLLKGNIGKSGSGVCPVRGHSNVQGDRTMGIHENPPQPFLDALEKEFRFRPPQEPGFNVVEAIEVMHKGEIDFFMSLGGNFIAAAPDTSYTNTALANTQLSVQVSTKLNRSHLFTGKEALILPCLGRTEKDIQNNEIRKVTVEDSMSMVHQTHGLNEPASNQLLAEPVIVARIAQETFKESSVDWKSFEVDYNTIRTSIERVVQGFEDFQKRVSQPHGFHLRNSAAVRDWNTISGKAEFRSIELPKMEVGTNQFRLMTIRSHDQYNTTIYGLNDRYRGVKGERDVLFMNDADIIENGWQAGQRVTVKSIWKDNVDRRVENLKITPYDIKKGSLAAYFPECNPLIPLNSHAEKSFTPTSKFVVVEIITL